MEHSDERCEGTCPVRPFIEGPRVARNPEDDGTVFRFSVV
jgi:hypothetical protein